MRLDRLDMSNELWLRYSMRGTAGSSRRLLPTTVHEVGGTTSMKLSAQGAEVSPERDKVHLVAAVHFDLC